MDMIAALMTYNGGTGTAFEDWPLQNYTSPAPVQDANLVHVFWINLIPQIVALTHPSANTIHVQGRGNPSTTYTLQKSATPDASGFTSSVNVTTGTQGNFNYDDNSPGTRKFYRLS